MTDLSLAPQTVISKDGNTATTYKVVTTVVDIKALKDELAEWEGMTEPSDAELIEMGKMSHPYYLDRETRIEDLKRKLEEVK